MVENEVSMWVPPLLAFLGALVGAAVSHFGLKYIERQRRITRFDAERLEAYSTLVGSADMAVFHSTFPEVEDRPAVLEAELHRMRITVGRVQLLAKTEQTRRRAYALLEACNSLYSPVLRNGIMSLNEVDTLTTEPIRTFLVAARAELEIEDQ